MAHKRSGTHPAQRAWPFRGRVEEFDVIRSAIGPGGMGSVVVLGQAGVGKTTLLREIAASEERAGHPVRWIIGSPLVQHVALGAVTEFLPAETIGAEPAALAAHARRALLRRDGESTAIVFVDDAHLLDPESAAIVHQLCLSRSVSVVCAARRQARAPALMALCRDERTTVLELQPLGPDDVAAVLSDVLGGPVDPSTAHTFYERSSGGALFLRELVEDARRSGSLRRDPVGWTVRREWRPGTELLDLVHARLQRDDEDENRALEIVAVGEPVSLGLLLALVPETAAEHLERERLLEVRRDKRRSVVAFVHPLYGDACRARVESFAARRHRLRLADAVEAVGARRRGDLLAIALWRLDGGDLASDQWLLAAQRALVLRHHASTALAERAVNASATAASWTVLGEARTLERDLDGAMAAFVAARAEAESDNDVATVAVARAKSAFWVGQQVDGAVEELEATESELRDGASRALLAAQRVSILVNSGRTREGVTLADQVVSGGLLEPAARRWVQLVAANGLAFLGETRRARSIAEALIAEPEPIASTFNGTGSPVTSLIIAELLGGNLLRADELLGLAGALVQDPESAGFVAALHGRVALWQGKPRTAIERLNRARDGLAAGMSPWRSSWCEALRLEADALIGLPSRPVRLVLGPTNEIAHRFLALDTLRSEASRLATTGDLPGARAKLREATDQALAHELLAAALLCHYERFRLRDPDAAPAVLALADRVDGSWSTMCAAHVRAWENGDAVALEAAAARFAEAGMWLHAAECAADALTTSQRAGQSTAARRANALAHELRSRIEGCWSPRLDAVSSTTPLTEREHEIALMAGSGLSNRQIAERLVVGVRTVEGHLLRIYAKVGVRSRRELAALFASATRSTDGRDSATS
ncbi:MAG: LuxR C-terminal-related transcriptional regulator [Ilumatobacteraceae bacterium]